MKRTCSWDGCNRPAVYFRRIKLPSGVIQEQVRSDKDHCLCSRHNRKLQESIRSEDAREKAKHAAG